MLIGGDKDKLSTREDIRWLKNELKENVIYDIRKVDPTVNYKDGRIQKFMGLFNKIIENMRNYWKTEKPNVWDYFSIKILKALGISYVSYKMLKEEEEEQKRMVIKK